MPATIEVVSTNVGLTQLLGERRNRRVFSAINKTPVTYPTLYLGYHGLQGDQQTDGRIVGNGRPVHGGPLKAVYAYPFDHYSSWTAELEQALQPGAFGENLTVGGVREQDVHIGEIWTWGDARLEVVSPRRPCYKLNMHRGAGTSERMATNGRCGWYLKVLKPGEVPATGVITVEDRPLHAPTILEVFFQKMRREPNIPDMPED